MENLFLQVEMRNKRSLCSVPGMSYDEKQNQIDMRSVKLDCPAS